MKNKFIFSGLAIIIIFSMSFAGLSLIGTAMAADQVVVDTKDEKSVTTDPNAASLKAAGVKVDPSENLTKAEIADQPVVEKSKSEKNVSADTSKPVKSEGKMIEVKPKKAPKDKNFTMNFNNVDIIEFLTFMSQLTQKNILIDERVVGKITITSVKKIPVDQAFNVMKSILELKGLAVIETDNFLKIMPIADAVKKNNEVIQNKPELVSGKEETITYILEIENAYSEDIANVLRNLKSNQTNIVTYNQLNIIIMSGSSSDINGLIKIAKALDKKIDEDETPVVTPDKNTVSRGNIHVVHLQNADAEQLGNVLARIPFSETAFVDTTPQQAKTKSTKGSKPATTQQPQQAQQTQQQKSKLSIVSNKETNSLIITATAEEFEQISRIIKELDTVREQVLIEALIVEVNADTGWNYGIDWMLGNQSGPHSYGSSNINSSSTALSDWAQGKSTLPLPSSTGFQLGYLFSKDVLGFIMLNATGNNNLYNVLSTPQILTIDNEEAELNVGEEIPIPTNNVSSTGANNISYDYKSVGVKLKLTPHITSADKITIDLYQEVNSTQGNTTQIVSGVAVPPKLTKRDIKTKITVEDGKTVVVGGLISNNKSDEETKVPLLGDIPVLGWIFKKKVISNKKTNLLVFITPYIVTKSEKLDSISGQKREELKRVKEDN